MKENVHVRLTNMFVCPELTRFTVPQSCDIGRLLSITGEPSSAQYMAQHQLRWNKISFGTLTHIALFCYSPVLCLFIFLFVCLFVCLLCVSWYLTAAATVVRTSTVKVLEREREYVCSRCKKAFMVEADFEQFYTLPKPERWTIDYCTRFGPTRMWTFGSPRANLALARLGLWVGVGVRVKASIRC